MLIGLVLPASPSYSETFFRNKIRALADLGIKVIVFVNDPASRRCEFECVKGFSAKGTRGQRIAAAMRAVFQLAGSPIRSARLFRLNRRDGYTLGVNLLGLLSTAHLLKFDLDWLHFGYATLALGRENLAAVIGARMAASIRGFDIAVFPLRKPGCYKLLWERLDKLHYISDDLFALARREGFNSAFQHQKITPAIDTKIFEPRARGVFERPLKIVTVARLHWKKGLEYTLTGLSLLRDRGFDFRYTVIGEGDERERLTFASHQLGIADRVSFVGQKSPEETRRLLSGADLYLQYSIQEGFCNATLEAQASGLLCIVSDAEGLTENVIDGKTGWVVPKRRPRMLAEQIIQVLDLSPSERSRISQQAIARTRSQFDMEKQKLEFARFYREPNVDVASRN